MPRYTVVKLFKAKDKEYHEYRKKKLGTRQKLSTLFLFNMVLVVVVRAIREKKGGREGGRIIPYIK